MTTRLCSLVAIPLFCAAVGLMLALKPAAPAAPPAEAPKTEKDKQPADTPKTEKDKQPADTPKAEKDKPPDEPAKKEEPEEKESPAAPYIKILQDPNPVVRKRAVLILKKMAAKAKDAIPALLETATFDRSLEIKLLAFEILEKDFNAAQRVEAIVGAVQDKELDSARRRFFCRMLPGLHASDTPSKTADRAAIYKCLEEVVADDDALVRLTAATALEMIDAQKNDTGEVTQTVRALLKEAYLRSIKLTPDKVWAAVKAKYPLAKVQLSPDKNVLEVVLTGAAADWVVELGRTPITVSARETTTLREVAILETRLRGQH